MAPENPRQTPADRDLSDVIADGDPPLVNVGPGGYFVTPNLAAAERQAGFISACCHRTRVLGSPCPEGRICPHDPMRGPNPAGAAQPSLQELVRKAQEAYAEEARKREEARELERDASRKAAIAEAREDVEAFLPTARRALQEAGYAQAPDPVFRPAHYARYAIEPITFIVANSLPFLVGNVIKYVLRYDAKNGVEDLRKARRYIDILIEDIERRARGEAIKVPAV